MRGILVTILLLASGCLFGDCDYTGTNVTWTDPALFDHHDFALAQSPDGMQFDHRGLDVAFAGARVASLTWVPEDQALHREPPARVVDGEIIVAAPEDGEEQAFQSARHILRSITDLDDPEIEVRIEQLRDSKAAWFVEATSRDGDLVEQTVYQFRASIAAEYDLRRAWGEGEAEPAHRIQRADWTFDMAFVFIEVELAQRVLTVDAIGVATLEGPWPEAMQPREIEAEVRAALRDQGWPEPETIHIEGKVC